MRFKKLFLAGIIVFGINISGIGLKFLLIATQPGDKISKSHQTHSSANFAHNITFSGKLEKLSEILLNQNDFKI